MRPLRPVDVDPGHAADREDPAGDTWRPSALQQERLAYRRRRSNRSVAVAVASSAAIVVVLVLGLTSTPGWPRVQQTFFDPSRAWEALPAVATGLWLNIRVMLVCGVLILVVGL
ncbi:MAG: ABC transporter, permease protein (cluster 3, basic aa/glutamine/opines), partial [uncultured Friedmanniella sp.]